MVCQAFEFKHLPVAGGIFDQHPIFLERAIYIMQEQQAHDKREEAAKKRKKMGGRNSGPPKDYMT